MSDAETVGEADGDDGERFDRSQTTFQERREARGQTRTFGSSQGCGKCGAPFHEHRRVRVSSDHGPAGSYHYEYGCPLDAVSE